MKESKFYTDASTKAVEAEKAGEFSYAGQLWESAAYSALSLENRRWAKARADFCQYQLRMMDDTTWEAEAIHG